MIAKQINHKGEWVLVWSIFLVGLYYFCIRILGHQLQYIPGDLGDSRFVNYLLEHGYSWLIGKSSSFWTAPFMYPFQNNLALSDNLLGTQVFYSPWRMSGFSAETSFQLWWMCLCCCNFWFSYWAFHKFFKHKVLAAILAWVFAFSLFNLGQLNYMQMMARFPVAPAFYAAYRLVSKPAINYLLAYCSLVLYQFVCLPYTGFYLLYFSLLFILIYLLASKTFSSTFKYYFSKTKYLLSLGVLLGTVILLGLFLWPYAGMSSQVGLRLYKEVLPALPTIKSFLLPHESSLPWHFLFEWAKEGNSQWWLQYLFPGILLLATMLYALLLPLLAKFTKKEVPILLKSLALVSAIVCLLHLRVGDKGTLYALIFKLPGINSMRVLNRFMHVELFILLFIFGYLVRHVRPAYLGLLFLLIVMDNSFDAARVIKQSKSELQQRKETLKAQVLTHPDYHQQRLALVDTLTPAPFAHLDAMLVAQELGIQTINGYSSYCPDAFGEYFTTCSETGLRKWMRDQSLNPSDILIIYRTPQK
jgi:hypothetical protein